MLRLDHQHPSAQLGNNSAKAVGGRSCLEASGRVFLLTRDNEATTASHRIRREASAPRPVRWRRPAGRRAVAIDCPAWRPASACMSFASVLPEMPDRVHGVFAGTACQRTLRRTDPGGVLLVIALTPRHQHEGV